ncbi:hypothetical protein MHK_006057, partial [Candidatus Magnetomorum sp. HK-1]
NEYFSYGVDIDGDYAIATAPYDDEGSSIYVFNRQGSSWTKQQKIIPQTFKALSNQYAAIYGDYIVCVGGEEIGVYSNNIKVYLPHVIIYKKDGNTWSIHQDFTFNTKVANLYQKISISENYFTATIYKRAYIFKLFGDTWKQIAQVSCPYEDLPIENSDDFMVIGYPNATINGKSSQGKAFVYQISEKPLITFHKADVAVSNPIYFTVTTSKNTTIDLKAISKNNLIVPSGGININNTGRNTCQVNITANEPACLSLTITPGWGLFADVPIAITATDSNGNASSIVIRAYSPTSATETKFLRPDGINYKYFGRNVSIGNNFALVSAEDDYLFFYEYDGTNWVYRQRYSGYGVQGGSNMAISGDYAFIGRPYASPNGEIKILRRSGSSMQAVSTISGPTEVQYYFGNILDADNGYLISAQNNNTDNSVYIYKQNGSSWNQV